MNLVIIRHGETEEGRKGVILGSLPGTLSAKGKKEAVRVAEFLKKRKEIPEIIMVSDLERAKKTAEIIGEKLKIPIILKRILRERGAGAAEGKTEKEIDWEKYEGPHLIKRKDRKSVV